MLPIQTAINTRLARGLGSTWLTSLISFTIGTLALGTVVAIVRPSLSNLTNATTPWWMWIGGLCGVIYLTFNMVLMRNLGAAAAVVIPVVGQVFGGLIIDAGAIAGAPHHALTPARIAGSVLVVIGAGATVIQRSNAAPQPVRPVTDSTSAHTKTRIALVLTLAGLGILSGALSALQTTVNGALGKHVDSPLLAALVSFLVGTVVLALINVTQIRQLRQTRASTKTTRPPLSAYTGGLLGAAFVFGSAMCAPILGTATTVSIILLGQLASSMLIDHFGALGAPQKRANTMRVAGCLIVLAGVALVRLVG